MSCEIYVQLLTCTTSKLSWHLHQLPLCSVKSGFVGTLHDYLCDSCHILFTFI